MIKIDIFDKIKNKLKYWINTDKNQWENYKSHQLTQEKAKTAWTKTGQWKIY